MTEALPHLSVELMWRLNEDVHTQTCPLTQLEFHPAKGPWLHCARTHRPVDTESLAQTFPSLDWSVPATLNPLQPEGESPGEPASFEYRFPLSQPDACLLLGLRFRLAAHGAPEAFTDAERETLAALLLAHTPACRAAIGHSWPEYAKALASWYASVPSGLTLPTDTDALKALAVDHPDLAAHLAALVPPPLPAAA